MNPVTYVMELAFDSLFAQSPQALEDLAAMRGKVICLDVMSEDNVWFKLFFCCMSDSIQVKTEYDGEPDVSVSGRAFDLYHLASGAGRRSGATNNGARENVDINISGDVDLGNRFMKMLSGDDVTVADIIFDGVGGTRAHHLKACAGVFTRTLNTLTDSLGDYLREEARVTPDPAEIKYFAQQVDELRDACASLEVRLRRHVEKKDAGNA